MYISWDIDDSKIKDSNNINSIYYYVSIKNKNNIFNLPYRTQEKYYYYDYLSKDNEYEIKVRSEIGSYCSDWSEVIKIKTGKKDKNEINIGFFNIFEIILITIKKQKQILVLLLQIHLEGFLIIIIMIKTKLQVFLIIISTKKHRFLTLAYLIKKKKKILCLQILITQFHQYLMKIKLLTFFLIIQIIMKKKF